MRRLIATIGWVLLPCCLTTWSASQALPSPPRYPARLLQVDGMHSVMAGADFNGDGNQDLFVAGLLFGSLFDDMLVLPGRGDGTFGAPLKVEVAGSGVTSVGAAAVDDFDGDGRPDLVLATGVGPACGRIAPGCNPGPGDVILLLGLGDGRFSETARAVGADRPVAIATGDFNGDRRRDVAVAYGLVTSGPAGEIMVLLGDGSGGLEPATSYLPNSQPSSVTVADFDHDGRDDLAVSQPEFIDCDPTGCRSVPGSITILWGRPDGHLETGDPFDTSVPSPFPVSQRNSLVAAGQFNHDARADLAHVVGSRLVIYLNRGQGTFIRTLEREVGGEPRSLIVDDMNDDGHQDIVTANDLTNDVSVVLGDGRGSFATEARIGVTNGPMALVPGDFDADGAKDLAALGAFDQLRAGLTSVVAILDGRGNGSFLAPDRHVTEEGPSVLAISDLDMDGDPDIAVATPRGGELCSPLGCTRNPGLVSVFRSNGDGTYADRLTFEACDRPVDIEVGDLNVDGVADLTVACGSELECDATGCRNIFGEMATLLGEGGGSFGAPVRFEAGVDPSAIVLGDLDEDGLPDLAAVTPIRICIDPLCTPESGNLSILLGRGDGTFGAPMEFEAGVAPNDIGVADLDGDGHLDLVVTNPPLFGQTVTDVSILSGRGDGTVGPPSRIGAERHPFRVVVDLFNDDAVPDLVLAGSATVSLLLGRGDGTFETFPETLPAFFAGGPIESLAVADLDADGDRDIALAAGGDVSVLLWDGNGGFGDPIMFGAGGPTLSIGLGMFDDDGMIDIAVTTCAARFFGISPRGSRSPCTGDTGLTVMLQQPVDQRILDARIEIRNRFGSGSGVVSWRTTHERTVTGFNVLRIDGDGDREILNASPIPCSECTTGGGAIYEYVLPRHKGGNDLFIEGVCADPCPDLLVSVMRATGRP